MTFPLSEFCSKKHFFCAEDFDIFQSLNPKYLVKCGAVPA